MQIDGKNYTKPGAYVPGGEPELIYIASDSLVNLQVNFPAASYPGRRARDITNKIDVISQDGAWVPDIKTATDFSTIDDTKVPTLKAVNDQITDRLSSIVAGQESFTFRVLAEDTPHPDANNTASFRLPWDFTLTEIRAYVDVPGNNAQIEVMNNGVDVFDNSGPPGTQLLWIEPGNESCLQNVVHPTSVAIANPVCMADDKITVRTNTISTAKGLTVILIGTRT